MQQDSTVFIEKNHHYYTPLKVKWIINGEERVEEASRNEREKTSFSCVFRMLERKFFVFAFAMFGFD